MKNVGSSNTLKKLWLACALTLSAGASCADMWAPIFQEQLESARTGDADAQYQLAAMYLKGQGTQASREQAIHWLEQASNQQHEGAESRLRRIHANEEKFQQTRKQALGGNAEAQYELAQRYLNGSGVAPDETKAIEWLQKAHEQGNDKATTRLGIVYFKSATSEAMLQRAFSLLTQASGDNMLAQYYLGEMYAEGKGVKQDFHIAKTWYQRAAESGFNRAYGNVVNMEEEIQMEQRRLAQAEAEAAAAAEAAEAEPVELVQSTSPDEVPVLASVEEEQAIPAESPDTKKATSEKTLEVVKKERKKPVEKTRTAAESILASHWLRGTKPLDFLPSPHTRCEQEDGRIICLSDNLQREDRQKTIRYRVKSIITVKDKQFDIVYRNLVLGVTEETEMESEEGPLAYDGEQEKGYAVKTGWSSEHTVHCEMNGGATLKCVKNNSHAFTSKGVKRDS